MTSEHKFSIPGPPVGKRSPRFARFGKFTKKYKDEKTVTDEGLAMLFMEKSIPEDHEEIVGPVAVEIVAFMPIPKSTSKKRQALMLEDRIKHVKKPDASNIAKFYEDCLSLLKFWKDDNQVCDLSSKKFYSEKPRTEITVRELEYDYLK